MKKIIIIFIVVILLIFFSIVFLVSKNNSYITKIEKEIRDNYDLKDDIKYLNKNDLYYIILTNKKLIVLNKEYKEIFTEEVSKISKLDMDIVYRLNNVMYEEKKVSNDKIIYNYYDIYTNELVDTLEIGG